MTLITKLFNLTGKVFADLVAIFYAVLHQNQIIKHKSDDIKT